MWPSRWPEVLCRSLVRGQTMDDDNVLRVAGYRLPTITFNNLLCVLCYLCFLCAFGSFYLRATSTKPTASSQQPAARHHILSSVACRLSSETARLRSMMPLGSPP